MTIATLPQIMDPAFQNKYGVVAFNVVDDITMDGLIRAAEEALSPLIVQVSVKTVEYWGAKVIKDMFMNMAGRVHVPVALHLDHCPNPEVAKRCLQLGWNSVLFDGSKYSFEDNFRVTEEITKYAAQFGAHVEGELTPVAGVEDGVGSENEGKQLPIEKDVEFIKGTGIYCYAPAVGTAHGFYKAEPEIRYERMKQLVAAAKIPMVLHGGTGLSDDVLRRLINLGAAKVNISTALKKTYSDSFRSYLNDHPAEYNPIKLNSAVRSDVMKLARNYFTLLGSMGRSQ